MLVQILYLQDDLFSAKIALMKTLILLFIIIIILCLLVYFLLAPKRASAELRKRFCGCKFAHRGLHSKDKTVPENSLSAFRLAIEAGYGIELDIRLTKDQKIVVFHDDTVLRMCGIDRTVDSFTYEELKELRLLDTDERIPLFSEVLSLVAGRIPLLVEFKSGPSNVLLCESAYDMLQTYSGVYCIESFHPMIVRWFKKHAPQVLRGQLSAPRQSFAGVLAPCSAFLLSHLLTNFLARPNFIAYHKGKVPFSVAFCQRLGALRAVWTLRDTDYHDLSCIQDTPQLFGENDMIIFEFFRP